MTNKQIYSKTLTFSMHRFIYDILAFVLLGAMAAAGFLVMDKVNNKGLIGLGVGLVLGLIAVIVILRYVSYTYKAGQIAMMTRGVTEGDLPQDVLKAGKTAVKERFGAVAAFFAITGAISAIFSQITRGLTGIGKAAGGDTGKNIMEVISFGIQVVVAYLCDCCLGWVFYRKEEKATKATCEGAVLFFKHGKTLLKNLGRVFGMGLLSFVTIGGVFFGAFFGIFSIMPGVFERLTAEIGEAAIRMETTLPEAFNDPKTVLLICAALAAIILWNILHSVFVRPYILVGVLRNYMESGMNNIPSEESFALLDSKSARFKKLRAQEA